MSGTTWVSRYQKGKTRKVKTNLDLLEQEIVSGNGICWAICKSAPHPRQPCQHSTTQIFTGWMPFLSPNQQRQSTEGNCEYMWCGLLIIIMLSPVFVVMWEFIWFMWWMTLSRKTSEIELWLVTTKWALQSNLNMSTSYTNKTYFAFFYFTCKLEVTGCLSFALVINST